MTAITLELLDELYDRCVNAPPQPMILPANSFPLLVRKRMLTIKGLRWYFAGQWAIFAPTRS